ncbi:adenosine/AMP deaminase [Coniella lustricola]|uniref:adenosine deaminase n=1 Tax=Coniella lustricola TaxID=2025994 RepID=A0A2T2ZUW2_9PEZI|nr:adenosine/AMP deaminase [Coniella lustricola]
MDKSPKSKATPLAADAADISPQWNTVTALDQIADARVDSAATATAGAITTAAAYQQQRDELLKRERALGFEHRLASTATAKEQAVDRILQDLKRDDADNVFAVEPTRQGFNGQQHSRFAGDHFLSNKALIDKSKMLKIARKVPKGAHLHIHFNACLQPNVLLDIAGTQEQMYITSDLPLIDDSSHHNYKRAKLQFSIMAQSSSTGNLFDAAYKDRQGAQKFKDFLAEFPKHRKDVDAMTWLQDKLVFREDEAHNMLQTVTGAWEEFNTRTQMMKGLFNYESAYRQYTRKCLEDFVSDNIQYAEIRPNFMEANQVWTDDGTSKIDNVGIMEMIIDEYEKFQAEATANSGPYFGGLKVIYCCPRSYPKDKVANGLKQCLEFKKKWPKWIAGFDLVGEEGKGKPLNFFVPEFLQFQKDCQEANVEIPFLFHCGETLEMGSETDSNLLDALLLKSKRIGHGFALARHPYIMERMKQDNVCLELCPISNEVLGLTPRINGHAMYNLLANNVHCTISSDNGTLFNSTLSHDFYQAMIGKADMTLYGWKQLIEWSLQHSCLSREEYASIHAAWAKKWDVFLDEVIAEFGGQVAAASNSAAVTDVKSR